jgi:plasmid stability protein
MAMLTERNISDELHRATCARAAQHGHSMEAEVRGILESAVNPQGRLKPGSLLADMGAATGNAVPVCHQGGRTSRWRGAAAVE